jgi:LPXTG-site transpeptidase (sortase) family protein
VRGYPTQGRTFTVWAGDSAGCVADLPGHVILCAGGDTAPQIVHNGHAIFRVSGNGPNSPGGLNIVVNAALSAAPGAPELAPQLNADALLALPPGSDLYKLDPASGRFVRQPSGRLRLAGFYKVLQRGTPPVAEPAPPTLPSTLPATGGSPFGIAIALSVLITLAGLGLARGLPRRAWSGQSAHVRAGVILAASGLLLTASSGMAYAYMATRPATLGFGTLDTRDNPTPRAAFAATAPSHLTIARLGIDTSVVALGIVNGAWQVPAYAAGYLANAASNNLVITGHDDQDGAVFRRLDEVVAGDVVQVYLNSHTYRYAVDALRTVPATQTGVLQPTSGPVLTLITCTPYLVDRDRLIVRAHLLS